MQPRDLKARNRARQLRGEMPDAERLLWWKLREANQNGFHFRRQVPIQGYFADFAEHTSKIVVELDGSQHGDKAQHTHDAVRDSVIAAEGYCILRFPNDQVFRDLDGGDRDDSAECTSTSAPHPTLRVDLPTRGR